MSPSGNTFSAQAATAHLRSFQRATVDHVVRRFFGPDGTRRFLVADETGLGKSLVARGVVAETIEHLLRDDSVERIDIVYVCSSADLAVQNLRRLDVLNTSGRHTAFADRLTLLALDAHRLSTPSAEVGKPVNLISFTPGTSFDQGSQFGKAEERALLYLLLADMWDLDGWSRRAARTAFRGPVKTPAAFDQVIKGVEWRLAQAEGGDERILQAFRREAAKHRQAFSGLLDDVGRRHSIGGELRDRARGLTGDLRAALAKSGVDTLEPDLVILDEFQRFRHLLDVNEGGEAAQLAHALFNHGRAKVLLLSATPYKPFSLAEESRDGDDHYADLIKTLAFLAEGTSVDRSEIEHGLASFRAAVLSGRDTGDVTSRLRELLLQVMCRTERPQLGKDGMLLERRAEASAVKAADLLDFVQLRRLADAVDGALTVDYWKSAPYFANFMDGYQLATKTKQALADPTRRPEVEPVLARTARLDRSQLANFGPLDPANARLRWFIDDVLGTGLWRLPWLAPALPYLVPGGPWADPALASSTKRLVFSSWAATPTAVASLVSYEAERRVAEGTRYTSYTPEARQAIAQRLRFRNDQGRPAAMTSLVLFWSAPRLAQLSDPLAVAAQRGEAVDATAARAEVSDRLRSEVGDNGDDRTTSAEAWYWSAPLRIGGGLPEGVGVEEAAALLRDGAGDVEANPPSGSADERSGSDSVALAHAQLAVAASAGTDGLSSDVGRPTDLVETVAEIGMHAPANIAWRALARLRRPDDTFDDADLWRAAAALANGFRSLFNRHDIQLLLQADEEDQPYWRVVLKTCADGNLQAVMDEYLHHLRSDQFAGALDGAELIKLANVAANVLGLRPAVYQANDPLDAENSVSFTSRFALRFGSRRGQTDVESTRLPELRNAFNSPFHPFVLATTSVGQEGLDFHWWCHAVVHWNTPASPVDFEQREGRVHRYGGHAIRRNVAAAHGQAVLAASTKGHPWSAAWEVAKDRCDELGDLAPHWIYPGPSKIERHVAPFPLSRDVARLEHLKDDLALYRLAFGQPRQEDILAVLQRRGVSAASDVAALRVDLSPQPAPDRSAAWSPHP